MTNKIIITKDTYNALTDTNPKNHIFNSDYGTLKYLTKGTATITIEGGKSYYTGSTSITHDLGYYPFVEVFCIMYIGTPSGNYEPCPFVGSGTTVQYGSSYRITTTTLQLYAQFYGVSSSTWTFDFIYFIFKNNLGL